MHADAEHCDVVRSHQLSSCPPTGFHFQTRYSCSSSVNRVSDHQLDLIAYREIVDSDAPHDLTEHDQAFRRQLHRGDRERLVLRRSAVRTAGAAGTAHRCTTRSCPAGDRGTSSNSVLRQCGFGQQTRARGNTYVRQEVQR